MILSCRRSNPCGIDAGSLRRRILLEPQGRLGRGRYHKWVIQQLWRWLLLLEEVEVEVILMIDLAMVKVQLPFLW